MPSAGPATRQERSASCGMAWAPGDPYAVDALVALMTTRAGSAPASEPPVIPTGAAA